MGRKSPPRQPLEGYLTIPMLEAHLRAYVEISDVHSALACFERLLRRRRTPHQTVCTGLLQLCCTHAVNRALYVLESFSEQRGLEVDDFTRLVRLFIMQRPSREALERFQEVGIDILTFADDSMHNYFAHIATLLNLELHEQLVYSKDPRQEEIGIITHKRQIDAAAYLSKKGSMATPIFHLLMAGMGGREGAQDEEEVRMLSAAPVGIATAEALSQAKEQLSALGLNASQHAAIEASLDRRLTLVQGPPGTGKTTVAVHLITLWVRALGVRPVLCCADSNVAVDNIGSALAAGGVNVVRLGRQEAVRADMHPYMADALGGVAAAAAGAEVVLATCVGSGADSLSKMAFEYVLIDETAQSTEPSCLVPLTHNCRSLVLVGDHKQLRPTVICEDAASRGLKLSMFERLLHSGVVPLMLDTQYRMHRSLGAFPSNRFYHGKLQSGTPDEKRLQPRGVPWPAHNVNVAFMPSSSAEDGSGESKRNSGEAHALIALLRSVLSAGELLPSDVGVITPYSAQVAQLRQMAAALPGGRAVEIMTVDGFQGREKELIIFSAVRSGRSGSLGFVADERRLNVMLTRAKRGLVVIGDPRTLVHSRHWADWLSFIEKAHAVVGDYSWVMPNRPPRARGRSPSEDIDALGRRRRRDERESDSDSEAERKLKESFTSRAKSRKQQRKARRAAAAVSSGGAEGQSAEEEQWRVMVRQAAEAAARDEHLIAQMGEAGYELARVADGADDEFIPPPPIEDGSEAANLGANGSAGAASHEVHRTSEYHASGEALAFGLKASAAKRKKLSDLSAFELAAHTAEAAAEPPREDPALLEWRRAEGRRKREALAKTVTPTIEVANEEEELSAAALDGGAAAAAELLPNWIERTDEQGGTYFHCTSTREASRRRPLRFLSGATSAEEAVAAREVGMATSTQETAAHALQGTLAQEAVAAQVCP